MKASFLCNSLLAMSSAQYLYEQQHLSGLATSSKNPLLSRQACQLAQQMQVPFAIISAKNIESDLITWIEASSPDAVIVQTFPHLIPASCLKLPPLGFFNLHPSRLPTYRGPDPIFWQLANGETEGGVTLHKMEEKFDTGPILHIQQVPIEQTDTYGLLQSNLSFAAIKSLDHFLNCTNVDDALTPQIQSSISTHGKPQTDDLMIDWSTSSNTIQALSRACNPHQNGAITFFRDVLTRILEVKITNPERVPKLPAGSIIAADETRGLQVLCTDDLSLEINILHVEEGYYSGRRFCEVFDVRLGEKFCMPAFLS